LLFIMAVYYDNNASANILSILIIEFSFINYTLI